MTINHSKRILIAPLDWGLGHATRCIPVIRELLVRGHTVVIAAQGRPAALLRQEFPNLPIVPIINYAISYSVNPLLLALKFPGMLLRVAWCAHHEHRQARRIVDRENIDVIISDNRFGCYDRRIPSIFISHQLSLKMPTALSFLEPLFWFGLNRMARRFTETWIPDFPGTNGLTGDLTRRFPLPPRHRYIGLLSRLHSPLSPVASESPLDLLVSLSGPEPQRTILEKAVVAQLHEYPGTAVVLLGKAGEQTEIALSPRIRIISHVDSTEMLILMRRAKAIICRGGYTTIMELVSLRKKAILIPTPGQTEQEYLCGRLARLGMFVVQQQSKLDVNAGLKVLESLNAKGFPDAGTELLREAVEGLEKGSIRATVGQ